MKVNKKVTYSFSVDGLEFNVEYCPADWIDPIIKREGDQIKVGYLMHDNMCDSPLETCDSEGCIYEGRRRSSQLHDYCHALGLDRDGAQTHDPHPWACLLDVYEHGGIIYSVSGSGTQCRWDTARGGAVWVPDKYAEQNLEAALESECAENPDQPYEVSRRKVLTAYVESVLPAYNAWCNGDTYGISIAVFDLQGRSLQDEETCWGFYGSESAIEEIKSLLGVSK